MGIVNVTPDSFSDGGLHADSAQAVDHGVALVRAGADIVDVGGESTRPGAQPVSAEEEMERVLPVVAALAESTEALISIDTSKHEVARAAIEAGAHLVNDVTGLRDAAMVDLLGATGTPAILMHMQGEPRTMQREPRYADVVSEVEAFLLSRAEHALTSGVPSVVIDPGLGFGKTVEHNLALVRAVPRLASHGYPVLIGGSRKRTIGLIAGVESAAQRDPGSIAWHLYAASQGAAVVRVHDIAGHNQAFSVWRALDG